MIIGILHLAIFLLGDFCLDYFVSFLDLRRAAKVNNRFCGEGYKSLQPTRFEVELCTTILRMNFERKESHNSKSQIEIGILL